MDLLSFSTSLITRGRAKFSPLSTCSASFMVLFHCVVRVVYSFLHCQSNKFSGVVQVHPLAILSPSALIILALNGVKMTLLNALFAEMAKRFEAQFTCAGYVYRQTLAKMLNVFYISSQCFFAQRHYIQGLNLFFYPEDFSYLFII